MAVVTAAIDFEDAALPATLADCMAADANRYPDLLTEPLFDTAFCAARHLVPRRAHEVGRLTATRPDEQTVVVGGPARTHAEGAVIARELTSPGTATAALPFS